MCAEEAKNPETEPKKITATIANYKDAPLFQCKTCSRPGNLKLLSWNDCDKEPIGNSNKVALFCPDYEKSGGKGCGNQLGIYSLDNPVDESKIKKIIQV